MRVSLYGSLLVLLLGHAATGGATGSRRPPGGSAQQCSSESGPAAGADNGAAGLQEKYIVRFRSYQMASQHHQQLSATLEREGSSWSWVARHNAAAAHPTDFAVLSIAAADFPHLSSTLMALPDVRDVHTDKHYARRLSSQPGGSVEVDVDQAQRAVAAAAQARRQQHQPGQVESGVESAGERAELDEGAEEEEGAEQEEGVFFDMSVEKRPGRLATSFMMEAEDLSGSSTVDSMGETRHDRRRLSSVGSGSEFLRGSPRGDASYSPSYSLGSDDDDDGGSFDLVSEDADNDLGGGLHRRGAHSFMGIGEEGEAEAPGEGEWGGDLSASGTRRLLNPGRSGTITALLDADHLWKKGYSGKNVKVRGGVQVSGSRVQCLGGGGTAGRTAR